MLEFGLDTVEIGRTSITIACRVRAKDTGKIILRSDRIVFVAVDRAGDPGQHRVNQAFPGGL